ncbi:tectonin beta-propeller repeat-containing protein 1-like isoform X2 [Sycon ciliatum]|uniref:tectonin beta-propeller repeat-containing protein 1-like isoform X2 n=1 Tax=Sycon ciliatum TaxID=27933 RepID=UPI0031F5F9BB
MTTGVGLWLLDSEGRVFRFLGALQDTSDEVAEPEEQWKLVKGRLKRISATRDCAWGLDVDDRPVVYVHSTYVPIRVEVDVYETETRGLLGRSGSGHPAWTNSDGTEQRAHPQNIELPSVNWEWERAWGVDHDHTETDSNGWYSPHKGVRQRRWIRHRAYTMSDRFAPVPGIDPENHRYDPFRDISVGGTELPGRENGALCVWAVTLRDTVVFREGVTRTTPEGVSWLKVPTAQKAINQISVGPSGSVWATTYDGSAFVRVGASRERPSGIRWVHVPSPGMYFLTHIAVGLNVVWATSTGHKVWFRKGIVSAANDSVKSSMEGSEWVEMVGESEFLSVGPDDQVYMLGAGGWPVQCRSGVRREELGGLTWVELHGNLGRQAYIEEKNRLQKEHKLSGSSALEMDTAGAAMIRSQILRSKQSFRRSTRSEGTRNPTPVSLNPPSPSLSMSAISLGRSSPIMGTVAEDRPMQVQAEDKAAGVVKRRDRASVVRDSAQQTGMGGRERTSSMPTIASTLFDQEEQIADQLSAMPPGRSRSFGFSPGMIAKAEAHRKSTHENASPEFVRTSKGHRACAVYSDDPTSTESHVARLQALASESESIDGGSEHPTAAAAGTSAATSTTGGDTLKTTVPNICSPDMSDFVKVSFATQEPYNTKAQPTPSDSIPCRKHTLPRPAEDSGATIERRLSRDSPLLNVPTASSSCTTTDSGISVNLTAQEGETDCQQDTATVSSNTSDEHSVSAPDATTTATATATAAADGAGDAAVAAAAATNTHSEGVTGMSRESKETDGTAVVSAPDTDTKLVDDEGSQSSASKAEAPESNADEEEVPHSFNPSLDTAGPVAEGVDETDGTLIPSSDMATENNDGSDGENVILSKTRYDPNIAIGLEERIDRVASRCGSREEDVFADSNSDKGIASGFESGAASSTAATAHDLRTHHVLNTEPRDSEQSPAMNVTQQSPVAAETPAEPSKEAASAAEPSTSSAAETAVAEAAALALAEASTATAESKVVTSASNQEQPSAVAEGAGAASASSTPSAAEATVAEGAGSPAAAEGAAAALNPLVEVTSSPAPMEVTATSSTEEPSEDELGPISRVLSHSFRPEHPVMSVHCWKWISAGGCVPPHDDVTKPGAFLGSGLTAAVTLCRRARTTKRRESVLRKTGWRQNILRQLRERNEREVAAFKDSMDCGDSGVWSKKGPLTWCPVNASSHPPYNFTSVSAVLNRGSRHGGQLELMNMAANTVERINLGDVSCVMPIPSDDVGQPYCFVVHTPQHTEYNRFILLCCADERDRDDWYTAISLAAIRSQALDGPPAPNALWALTQSGEVYISDPPKNPGLPHERRWRAIGGNLRSISAGAAGVVWGIGFDGTPLAYNGGFGGGIFVQSVDATSSNLQEHTDCRWYQLTEIQQTKGVSWNNSVYEDDLGRTSDKKQGLLPSKAWKWTSEWSIDFENADQDGWQRLPKSKLSRKGPRRRSRKWKRRMTIITPGPWMEILPCPNCLASVSVQTWPQQPIGAHDNVAVWAMDVHGDVICRYGVTASQPQGEEWRWVSSNTKFISIAVGSDRAVWGISDAGWSCIRLGITDIKQSGTSWKRIGVPAPDRTLTEVTVGSHRVWVRDNRGDLWFRQGVTAQRPEGDAWIQVPGSVEKLTVSANNQLWTVQKGAICRLSDVTPQQPMGSKSWKLALQPCWYSISAGATDVSNSMTRSKTIGSQHDCSMIELRFEDLKAGFPLLVKGNNMFWCAAVFIQLDLDTDKIQVQMIHEGRAVRWCTRQNVTLDIPPPEHSLAVSMKVLYKYNYVGDSYYKLGDLESVNHLDNSYKIFSAVRNVARTKEDLRLPPEALADAQRRSTMNAKEKQRVGEAAHKAAGKYKKKIDSVRRRKAANISEEGHTGTVAMFNKLSGRDSDPGKGDPA